MCSIPTELRKAAKAGYLVKSPRSMEKIQDIFTPLWWLIRS
jgi:hypothetical protein